MRILATMRGWQYTFDTIKDCAKFFFTTEKKIHELIQSGDPFHDNIMGLFYFDILKEPEFN